MQQEDNNPPIQEDMSVVKSALEGAAIGAVLWPTLGMGWDAFSRHKVFVPGNRMRFIASQAAMGSLVNGALNGVLAWWRNHTSRKHAEQVDQQRQQQLIGTDLTPRY